MGTFVAWARARCEGNPRAINIGKLLFNWFPGPGFNLWANNEANANNGANAKPNNNAGGIDVVYQDPPYPDANNDKIDAAEVGLVNVWVNPWAINIGALLFNWFPGPCFNLWANNIEALLFNWFSGFNLWANNKANANNEADGNNKADAEPNNNANGINVVYQDPHPPDANNDEIDATEVGLLNVWVNSWAINIGALFPGLGFNLWANNIEALLFNWFHGFNLWANNKVNANNEVDANNGADANGIIVVYQDPPHDV
ncbi:hypothetical protein A2U01_0007355 [Trifolium medium]|uniref:Uncharacterized protein n=1 Tax=Trifolium medium TaxID=97028 RepID=A0A392MIG1_9FABA|nr:hypothetical protein [Trifolium medium]